MDSFYALLLVLILMLPVLPLAIVAHRRNWSFGRFGGYVFLIYGLLFPATLAVGLGIRGWRLGVVVLATTASGLVAFSLWGRVFQIGKEAEARRKGASSHD